MKKLLLRIAAMLSLLPLSLVTVPLSAQEGQQVGSGLQISPTRHEITVDPGASQKIKISLKNVTTSDAIAKVAVNSFTSDNQTGEPKINPNDQEEVTTSIKPFIEKLEEIPLKAGETKEFEVNFIIPGNASPGAYYGIIRYQAVPVGAEQPGQISLSASVGAIVLLDVPGNVTKSMRLESLKIGKDSTFSKFFTNAPNKAALEIKNNGNTFIKPFGSVLIADSKGNELHRYEINAGVTPGNVLPNSTRIFTDEVKNVTKFGKYTASANIGFEQGGEVQTITTTFWIVPLWMVILLLTAVILVAAIIFFTWRKVRPKKVKRQ